MKKLTCAGLTALMLSLCGCRFFTSFSEPASRQASSLKSKSGQCALALSSGMTCLLSEGSCHQAIELMKEIKIWSQTKKKTILNDDFVQQVSRSSEVPTEKCDRDLERWVIATFSAGKPAPFDVAGLKIGGLQELKLLIWGGGMVAGFLGDGVGSACMSAIGAAIGYAESKKWIECN